MPTTSTSIKGDAFKMMMIQEKHKTEAQHNNIQNSVYKLFILNKRNYHPGISYNVSAGYFIVYLFFDVLGNFRLRGRRTSGVNSSSLG